MDENSHILAKKEKGGKNTSVSKLRLNQHLKTKTKANSYGPENAS